MTVQLYPTELKTRYMTLKLTLDSGQFPSAPVASGGQNENVKIITANSDDNSLTVEAQISKQSGFMQNTAYVTIYGMTIEDCNAFSRFNSTYQLYQNEMEIYAGYELGSDGLPPLVYKGQIYTAGADFNNPSRPFKIVSLTGIYDQNILAPHTNPQGAIELNNLYRGIISKSSNPKLVYSPNGVNGTALNPVYTGSWIRQLQQATFDYGYQMNIDDNKVLITPNGKSFTNSTRVISKDTGMIGYPTIVELGVDVRVYFDPSLEFGQQITVQSDAQFTANGNWYINGFAHTLQNRGARWESVLKLNQYLYPTPTGGGNG